MYYIIFLYKIMYINVYTNILGLKYIFLCLMYSIGSLILKFSNLYKVSHKTLPSVSLYQKFLHQIYGLWALPSIFQEIENYTLYLNSYRAAFIYASHSHQV